MNVKVVEATPNQKTWPAGAGKPDKVLGARHESRNREGGAATKLFTVGAPSGSGGLRAPPGE